MSEQPKSIKNFLSHFTVAKPHTDWKFQMLRNKMKIQRTNSFHWDRFELWFNIINMKSILICEYCFDNDRDERKRLHVAFNEFFSSYVGIKWNDLLPVGVYPVVAGESVAPSALALIKEINEWQGGLQNRNSSFNTSLQLMITARRSSKNMLFCVL